MNIDWDIVMKVAGPLLGVAAGAVGKNMFEAKPNVVAFLQHATGIPLQGANPPAAVGTHSLVLTNTGRKAAKNVRLGHNSLPNFTIFPDVEYAVVDLPGGQREIRIPTLIPKKQLTIAYAYGSPLQWHQVNTHLEHDDGPVKVLNVLPTVQLPTWVRRTMLFLALVGAITAVYLFVHGALWASQRLG